MGIEKRAEVPVLLVDGNGTVNCGVCGYLAMAVKGQDPNGQWIEERLLMSGVPLVYMCVNCGKLWQECGPPCEPLNRPDLWRRQPGPAPIDYTKPGALREYARGLLENAEKNDPEGS